jgi:hypothetical protein
VDNRALTELRRGHMGRKRGSWGGLNSQEGLLIGDDAQLLWTFKENSKWR